MAAWVETGKWAWRVERDLASGLFLFRFDWVSDANGDAAYRIPFDFDGMLHRFVAKHLDAALTGTYNGYLYDDVTDLDTANGQMNSLNYGGTGTPAGVSGDTFNRALTTDRVRPISIAGRHTIYIDAGANAGTPGLLDLYYEGDEVDLQRAGIW